MSKPEADLASLWLSDLNIPAVQTCPQCISPGYPKNHQQILNSEESFLPKLTQDGHQMLPSLQVNGFVNFSIFVVSQVKNIKAEHCNTNSLSLNKNCFSPPHVPVIFYLWNIWGHSALENVSLFQSEETTPSPSFPLGHTEQVIHALRPLFPGSFRAPCRKKDNSFYILPWTRFKRQSFGASSSDRYIPTTTIF